MDKTREFYTVLGGILITVIIMNSFAFIAHQNRYEPSTRTFRLY
jgi:hypothetical protein